MNKRALIKLCKDADNLLEQYAMKAPVSYNVDVGTTKVRTRLEEAISSLEEEIAKDYLLENCLRLNNADY